MNYELAKELKDAGYPQTSLGLKIDSENKIGDPQNDYFSGLNHPVNYPSLSELIEACQKMKDGLVGTTFDFLLYGNGDTPYWEAGGRIKKSEGFRSDKRGESRISPEEAVARLWLALNNK